MQKAALFVPRNSVVTNPAIGYGEVKSKVIVMFGLSAVSYKSKIHVTQFISVKHTAK